MSKDKKDRRWDGKSRVSNNLYRRRYDEIFKKNNKNNNKPDDTSKKSGISTNLQVNAEIVNGTCPYCTQETVLVCLWSGGFYRCMTCGQDVEQKVNGKISYIPPVQDKNKFEYKMKVESDGQ
mgnify:CR=1 FL=1|tara:strand:+ start:319 stop:684 length:366 start_codon:yes stop_codon:yes gene_type:complete